MIAGAAVTLQFFPNPQPPRQPPLNPISLASATVTMKIYNPFTDSTSIVPMTPNSSNPNPLYHYATYQTQSTDFPVPGTYTIQCFIVTGGLTIKTPEAPFVVGPSL